VTRPYPGHHAVRWCPTICHFPKWVSTARVGIRERERGREREGEREGRGGVVLSKKLEFC
jgi:hypothetical protein